MSISQETNENLLAFCGEQKFATIYADPPWRFQNRTGKVAPENKKLNRTHKNSLDTSRLFSCLLHYFKRLMNRPPWTVRFKNPRI